jgi:hypothetical protein
VRTVFTKNRQRLLEAEVAYKFLAELLNHKEVRGLLSDEHFSVDGTQIQAWASMERFRAKDGSDGPPAGGRNGERDFHGEKRSNDTHFSTTDPEARLHRKGKGKEAKLSFIGNAMTENRHGLVVDAEFDSATGTIERETAQLMVVRYSPGLRRLTLGADKAYDVREFINDLRDLNVTPHIAQNTAIDARTTRHPDYEISQQKRKRTEEPFGWSKSIGGLARPVFRGVARLRFKFTLTMAAYDLIRLPKLVGAPALAGNKAMDRVSRTRSEPQTISSHPEIHNIVPPTPRFSVACSHVRFQGAARSFLLRRCGLRRSLVRTARDRTRRRRLNKLSCAGWVPHDRGSVSGLPRSRVERRSGDRLITGTRVPHRGPASSNVHLGF